MARDVRTNDVPRNPLYAEEYGPTDAPYRTQPQTRRLDGVRVLPFIRVEKRAIDRNNGDVDHGG
jgi:hypothetical protein